MSTLNLLKLTFNLKPLPRPTPTPRFFTSTTHPSNLHLFSPTRTPLTQQSRQIDLLKQRIRNQGFSGGGGRGNNNNGWRQRFDRIDPNHLVYGLIGMNVGVYALWQYAQNSLQRFRDPEMYYWMTKNFVVSEINLKAGRLHTLLTACFSQSSGTHILMNCLSLYFIAPAVASLVGPSAFLAIYLGGGLVSSCTSLAWRQLNPNIKRYSSGSEGASGAIYSALSFFATIFPNQTFLMFFVVPMPAWLAIGGVFAYDLYGSLNSPMSRIDNAGHIGGMVAGVVFALASKGKFRGRF